MCNWPCRLPAGQTCLWTGPRVYTTHKWHHCNLSMMSDVNVYSAEKADDKQSYTTTTRALLVNKSKAMVITARWPLEKNLNGWWAQLLHNENYSTLKQMTRHWWPPTSCFAITNHREAVSLWLVRQEQANKNSAVHSLAITTFGNDRWWHDLLQLRLDFV